MKTVLSGLNNQAYAYSDGSVVVPPSRSEIEEYLSRGDENALCLIGRSFFDAMIQERNEYERLGASQDQLEAIDDRIPSIELLNDVDYLEMSIEDIDGWYHELFEFYCSLRGKLGMLKRRIGLKISYYPAFQESVKRIYGLLSEISNSNNPYFLEYVASVKAELGTDYADRFPFAEMTEKEIVGYLDGLLLLEQEAHEVLNQVKGMEVGQESLRRLNIDSLKDLDDYVLESKREKEEKNNRKVDALSNAVALLHGKKDSLASIFKKGDSAGKNETTEASETKTDESYELDENYEIVDTSGE